MSNRDEWSLAVDSDPDEGNDQLLGEMLESMRDMVRVYTSARQDRIEELEAELAAAEGREEVLRQRTARDDGLLKDLRFVVARAELSMVSDTDTMARIRGLLHE